MYVRWVVRRHKNDTVANTSFHDAYLVESYRDERGNPRQRMICYLGNIRQIGDAFPSIERELFLLRAERILTTVPELSENDRSAALDILRSRVPPLSYEEGMAAFADNLRFYHRWWARHGAPPSDEEILRIIRAARDDAQLDSI
jgi:hypothetical protein